MKKILFLFMAGMCLLFGSCGNSEILSVSESEDISVSASEKVSISTPEKVYVTFYSGPDAHYWELSQDEINDWVVWMNNLTVSPLNLEESKILIDHVYRRENPTGGYSFDVGLADALERIEYLDCAERVYLRMDNDWYRIENPTEPFNRY